MRLTLRTMLAWLDNVLEPADAEILGGKIKESEFASGLVQRIQDVSKKLRMDAPKINGKGMGNDANTVSEYLDSTLPQDRVGDFERVCLDSDRHLAEVAGCHQVLTLVLGKPAEVPEGLRERVYSLAHVEAAAKPVASSVVAAHSLAKSASNGHAAAAIAADDSAVVPDYLRAGRRLSIWPFLGTIAGAFLIGAIILRMMGPFDRSHPLMSAIGGGTPVADATASRADGDSAPSPAEETVASAGRATSTQNAKTPKSRTLKSAKGTPGETDLAVSAVDASGDVPLPDRTPVPTPAVDEASIPTESPAPIPEPMPDPASEDPPMAAPIAAEPPAASGAVEVGRYISDEQLLAQFDQPAGVWVLKPARGVLEAGERLLVLPTYRPQLALPSGVQITFAGESALRMELPGETGASRMSVANGRFLVMAVGAAGAQIELNLGGIQGVATLVDADSTLAIKVARWLPPGSDPETDEGLSVAELFTTNGRVTWHAEGQERVEIPMNHVRVHVGSDPPETLGPFEPPAWIDTKSIAPIDRRAATLLFSLLEPEKPLDVSLQEKLADRRVEVRNLAARCLGAIDIFEPLLNDLANPDMTSFWFGEIDSLRQGLQRGPETAAHLRATIEGLRSADANVLYRLLWGFSQEQLETGGAVQLVKHLESEQMDVRVLTFYNLVAITGAQEFYRPEKRREQQKGALLNWNDRQKKGTISYKFPPSPLENYRPLEKAAAVLPGARRPEVGPIGVDRL